jgi:hypothetical protein
LLKKPQKSVIISLDDDKCALNRSGNKSKDIPFLDGVNHSWFREVRGSAILGRRRHRNSREGVQNQDADGGEEEGSSGEDITLEAVPSAANVSGSADLLPDG